MIDAWSILERVFGSGGVVAYHGVGEAPPVPIMHVTPARLRAQLEHLRERYEIVPLRDLVSRWHAKTSTRRCVAITFDDAYAGILAHALPTLRALQIPATVFVASDHAKLGAEYWWDLVARDRRAYSAALSGLLDASNRADWSTSKKGVDPADDVRAEVLARFAGRWPGALEAGRETVWRASTFPELKMLSADDLIDFGVHTLSHPALPLLPYEEQVAEMKNNYSLLQSVLPRVLPIVAYPYGLYDRVTVRAARDAGMIAGVTMEGRASADHPDPMIVPRIGAGEIHPPESLSLKLNRALRPAVVLRNRGIHPRVPSDARARSSRDGGRT